MTTVQDAPVGACPCGAPVEAAYPRHLTLDEYNQLPEGFKPIDGYAVKLVGVCGDCLPAPLCDHTPAEPQPCPDCGAQPGRPCTKPNGTARPLEHPGRDTHLLRDLCRHAHRETCTDPRSCACTADDPAPVRVPRFIAPVSDLDRLAALQVHPDRLAQAMQWAAQRGIDLTKVRSPFRDGYTQDNRPAWLFDYAQAPDDGHGHEVIVQRAEPLK